MTEPSRICAWMTWGSMWNLIIEIRKSTTHSLVPYPAYLSQWSLTFEVRKRPPTDETTREEETCRNGA